VTHITGILTCLIKSAFAANTYFRSYLLHQLSQAKLGHGAVWTIMDKHQN